MTDRGAPRWRKCSKAKLPSIGLVPSELLVYCPTCGALDVAHLSGPVLLPKRGFNAGDDGIYHACGSTVCSHFHTLGVPLRSGSQD